MWFVSRHADAFGYHYKVVLSNASERPSKSISCQSIDAHARRRASIVYDIYQLICWLLLNNIVSWATWQCGFQVISLLLNKSPNRQLRPFGWFFRPPFGSSLKPRHLRDRGASYATSMPVILLETGNEFLPPGVVVVELRHSTRLLPCNAFDRSRVCALLLLGTANQRRTANGATQMA
jgi:hypothetical protein